MPSLNNRTFVQFCRIAFLIAEDASEQQTTALPLLRAKILCHVVARTCGANYETIWSAAHELAFPTPPPEREASYPCSRRAADQRLIEKRRTR